MSVITSDRIDGVSDGGGGSGGGASGDVQSVATPVTDSSASQVVTGVLVGKDSRLDTTYNQVEATPNGALEVNASNIVTKFREAFETYTPGVKWTEVKGTGDLIYLDGNAASASYLVISKSPFNAGAESTVESISNFKLPMEISLGIHMSQRTVGQEFSFELIDTDTPLADITDLAIASIGQGSTVLNVNTTLPHNLAVGQSIGIRGVSDSRYNYQQLVVSAIPSTTQFLASAGPMATIPTLTLGTRSGEGFVYFRERFARAKNGISQIFENTSATNASMYVCSESGDALPSATIIGNHSVSCGSTASLQLVGSLPRTYAFAPTTEFRVVAQADRVQWSDVSMDSVGQSNNRLGRVQVCPNPDKLYKLRFRAKNQPSLTAPIAEIVSAVKSGTTTATITTATPHGLAVTDYVNVYGIRDQAATSFPNLLAATVVASIVSPTVFTIVIGTAGTVTSYGGYVARCNGGVLMGTQGAIAQVCSTATVANSILSLVGNVAWAGFLIGDTLELYGVRNNTTGADIGLDGTWRVRNIVTTTVELEAVGWTPPASLALTNCGGGVIKRTDFRISFVRMFDFERLRVEPIVRPSGDTASSFPVVIGSMPTTNVAQSGAWNTGKPIPAQVSDIASAALTTTTTTATITPTFGGAYEVNIPVTLVTGTLPTLDVTIEESDDAGTNWYPVYSFPRITATGIYRSPKLNLTGDRLRYVQTVGGTTPSFTRSTNRKQITYSVPEIRQLINRTIILTTLNSVTPNLVGGNTSKVQLVINTGAGATVEAQVQIEGSDDNGVTWVAIDTPLTTVLSTTVQKTVVNINYGLYRARVSTAGTAVTMGYVLLKAYV